MSDKRGRWSNEDVLNIFFHNNKRKRVLLYVGENRGKGFDFYNNTICWWCKRNINFYDYEGNVKYIDNKTWNIDHRNGNPKDNRLKNLQPLHVFCNRQKN